MTGKRLSPSLKEAIKESIIENWGVASYDQIAKFVGGTTKEQVAGQAQILKKKGLLPERWQFQYARGQMPSTAILLAKTCPGCGFILDAEKFHNHTPGVYSTLCRKCHSRRNASPEKSKDQNNKRSMRYETYQRITSKLAHRTGEPWTEEDKEILKGNGTIFEKAVECGRTFAATSSAMKDFGFSKVADKRPNFFDQQWIIRFPNAMKALQEEFKRLGVPEEEWMWTE
ncbi:DNA binding protein [Gordonia phage Patos]|uniref:DNA binding protein n=1 Tax=Gordonia phage Patos TaxID=2927262 RepID=A0A9E7U3A4_9CAUD|nr:DNA binding protein [Gordonia phage Patos]WNN95321.1 DNA binding protein [Gordonia phage NorManre]